MDRGAIIRTFRAPDLGYILHSRHQYHWHTGYVPPQTVAMPHIGAVISRTLGPKNPHVPAFISIGQNLEIGGESASVKAFHTAGFLGSEHGPFLITNPQDAAAAVRPPAGSRRKALPEPASTLRELLAREPVYQYAGDFQRESLVRLLESADRLLSHHRQRRSTFRSSPGLPTIPTTPDDSGRVACWPGVSLKPAPYSWSHHRIHPVPLLGHARARPRAREAV